MKSVKEWTQHWDNKNHITNPVELNGYCIKGKPIPTDDYNKAVVFPTIERLQVKPNQSVLDIGCGSGLMLDKMEEITTNLFGLEPSGELLKRYKGCAKTYVGAAHQLPFKKENFDRVLMFGVAVYFPDFEYFKNVVLNVFSLLKQDGIFLIGDLNIGTRPTESQYQWYDREELLCFFDSTGLRYNLMSQSKLKREINKRWDIIVYVD